MYAYFYCCNVVCFFVIRLFRMAWKKGFSILRPLKSKQGFYITLEWRRAWLLKTLSVKQNHTGQVYFRLKKSPKTSYRKCISKNPLTICMAAAAVLFKMAINLLRDCSWQKELILIQRHRGENWWYKGKGDISPFINNVVPQKTQTRKVCS